MSWESLRVSRCGTFHVNDAGQPAYNQRFDEVLAFHSPGLAPVHERGQGWHVRADGTAAYAQRFIRAFGFYEGLAAVITPNGWLHITTGGTNAYEDHHAWCGNFQQGRCPVRDKDEQYHHITSKGVAAYPDRWKYAGDYRDGIAVVQASDGHSTHIDLDGQLVHEKWFVDLDVFHKGFARARDEEGWVHIDSQGRAAYTRRFNAVEPFYNGQARVECFNGALEVIDERGETLVELRPPQRSEFANLSADMVGFWRTQTIGSAVELGVIEALPATESNIAESCGLKQDGTRRLLRALGELDIARQEGETWILTKRGELLRPDHPLTLSDAAVEYRGPLSTMWDQLPEALRLESSWSPPDVFGEVARDTSRRFGHHRMLQSYARHDYAEVCRALDLQGDERIVDAGGGLGVLAEMILDQHPSTVVTVLERPEVVAIAKTTSSKVHWRSGSLFQPWEFQADVILLSRVLHDWDDVEAVQILTHARTGLANGGRVYIIEMLIQDENVAGSLCDLHLLMASGGRERSATHFGRLLAAAGFSLSAVRRLPALPSILVGMPE